MEQIGDAKYLIKIQKIKLWSAAIFNIAAMLAAILKKKAAESHLGSKREDTVCQKPVKICHRLGGEAVHTDAHGCGHTDGRRVSPYELRN